MAADATLVPEEDDMLAILQGRVRDLEAVLNQHNAGIALTFQLTPAIANLLGLLMALPVVTPEAIQHRLEIATDPKIAIFRLRNKLRLWHEVLGYKDTDTLIQGRRHVGYWLSAEVKGRIKAQIEKVTAPRKESPLPTDGA